MRAELIVVTCAGSVSGPLQGIRIHHLPGRTVFDCRAAAISTAAADIVVLTEDHCIHPEGWCERILHNFATRPELVLLGGAVANGSIRRLDDLMNYWTTFAPYAPGQVTAQIPCVAQMALRKSAVDRPLQAGELEGSLVAKWLPVNGAIYVDPELVVSHVQSHGFYRTFVVHYHNGRTTAGYSPRRPSNRRLSVYEALRWSRYDGLDHFRRTRRSLAAGAASWPSRAAHLLLVMPLVLCHALGEFIGYRHGPGSSPHHLV